MSDFIRRRSASYGGISKQGFRSLVKMSRLHYITPWQGRKPSVLSEERLSPREVKTCVFVIFLPKIWAKKLGG
ncbi:MAG: hypothetical protein IJV89_08940 [Lentisphaeria bacterium]|nr:hypothetical protein [Lentisphaeria bacterium]